MIRNLFFITLAFSLIACGGGKGNENKENEDKKDTTTVEKKDSVAAVVYDTMTSEKLIGKWKVFDAAGYSRDSMMVQTYEFTKDKASFYKSYGGGGMVKGDYVITDGVLKITVANKGADGSVTSMTSNYKGGFYEDGKKLYLNGTDHGVYLERK